jgi:hypothetical protein
MAKLYTDTDKFESSDGPPIVEAFHSALKDLVRQKLDESGASWKEFVFGKEYELITPAEVEQIERAVLDSGYRFQTSAVISFVERPEAYKPVAGAEATSDTFSFEHSDAVVDESDPARQRRGQGDNVVESRTNVVGTARYYRSIDDVMVGLREGVPEGTIAIIDDSGGTLTAPILERFTGVVCAGGTVRSHLGILTREYSIPCLMNSKISGIRTGDKIEIGVSGPAKTTEAYQEDREMSVPVWKLEN